MLIMAPIVIAPVFTGYAGIMTISQGQKGIGIVLSTISLITGVLALRRMLAFRTASTADEGVGALKGPAFDYLIWFAIGLPLVFGMLLVAPLVSGQL